MSKAGLTSIEIGVLDRQLECLLDCKPLPENEIKQLCEKVYIFFSFIFILYYIKYVIGKRNNFRRRECATSKVPGDYLWRYSWTIL